MKYIGPVGIEGDRMFFPFADCLTAASNAQERFKAKYGKLPTPENRTFKRYKDQEFRRIYSHHLREWMIGRLETHFFTASGGQ